jgi:hypothetical protein
MHASISLSFCATYYTLYQISLHHGRNKTLSVPRAAACSSLSIGFKRIYCALTEYLLSKLYNLEDQGRNSALSVPRFAAFSSPSLVFRYIYC